MDTKPLIPAGILPMETVMAKPENKKSVYFGEPIYQLLTQVGEKNVSGAINLAVSRYLAVMEASRPALSRNEWLCIFDVLNSTITNNGTWEEHPGDCLALEIRGAKEDGAYEKWEIDGPALCQKLQALTIPQGLAVLHAANTFWAHSDLPTDMALLQAGFIDKTVQESVLNGAHFSNEDGSPASLDDIPEEERGVYAELWRKGVAKGIARMKAEKDAGD